MASLVAAWSSTPLPIVGMLHLKPLPGSPRFQGSLEGVERDLLMDAEALAGGGVDGMILENFGDAPFYPSAVPPHVTACMVRMALAVKQRFPMPLGINVLRNDGRSALAVAVASGAEFVRVNVLAGARVTDQGILQGIAHEISRDRLLLGAQGVAVLADIQVKHSAPLGPGRPLEEEVREALERAGADGVIITGSGTGRKADPAEASRARSAAQGRPVFIGSGVSDENIRAFLDCADGFIVGTTFKTGGRVENPVDPVRVRRFMEAARPGRSRSLYPGMKT